MSFITPRDGWDESDRSRSQSDIHPALAPHTQLPPPPPAGQPMQQPVQYVYLPQPQAPPPQFMSQTVVVQNQSSSGCLWLFVLLFPPLWPIALIIWLVNRSRSSAAVVNSSGYGYGTQQYLQAKPITMPPSAVVAAGVLTFLAIAFIAARNGDTTRDAARPVHAPPPAKEEGFWEKVDKEHNRCKTRRELEESWTKSRAIVVQGACYSILGEKRFNSPECLEVYGQEWLEDEARSHQRDLADNETNCAQNP